MMTDHETQELPEESLNEGEFSEEVIEEGQLSEIDQLRLELAEANETKLRALADFKNFQRRSMENEVRAVSGGMARVIRSILPAIEQMNMAIEHAGDDTVVQGFKMARDELLRGITDCGVLSIEPLIGDAFDPQFHEAMMRQESEEVETDHIVMVMQTGYRLGDIVICPAKVSVSS